MGVCRYVKVTWICAYKNLLDPFAFPSIITNKYLIGYSVAEHVKNRKDAVLTGSVLIGCAPSREVIEARIKGDAFCTEGVWDPETLVIMPFVSTLRKPL